jgi:F420-dependent oxidoreductase-like protein
MRIGIGVDGSTVDKAVEGVRQAKADGFASAWFSNIFGADGITLCAIAGREVEGIEVGTAVVPTFPRHPHAMAQQAITAHAATGGRFVLGIGLSHQVVIESMFGLSFDKPARHMREYLGVLLPLLREGSVSHDGDLYTVQATLDPIGSPAGGPKVMLAGLGPVMLTLTGSLTDGTITWMTGPKTIASHIKPALEAAAVEAHRPAPRIVCGLPICVTDDPDGARETAAKAFQVYGQLPSYRAMLDREGAAGPADVAIVGPEDQVLDGIDQLREAGVTDFNAAVFGDPDQVARTRALLQTLR